MFKENDGGEREEVVEEVEKKAQLSPRHPPPTGRITSSSSPADVGTLFLLLLLPLPR